MSKKYSTTTTLVIVESPAKCKKIEEYLGPGYKCIASFGHLREISCLKNIDIDNHFLPTYTIIDNAMKKKQIEYIRKEIGKSDDVILSTDSDREGEKIAYCIAQIFNLDINTTKRITFNEITESAIQTAIRNPRTIDMDLVYSQQARQVLDLLVGFKITPMLWKFITRHSASALSAGRCQTPALKLIYDNQKEIDKKHGEKVYNTIGYFTNQNIPFELSKQFENEEDMSSFLEGTAIFQHIYSCSQPKKCIKTAPEPFTTSKLQQAASNELHYSPKETMKLCQNLYEAGYITYMRTDSQKYSKVFIDSAKCYILRNYDDKYIGKNVNYLSKDKCGEVKHGFTQEAHEAIRPTNISLYKLPEEVDSKAKRMYKLIWSNALESCMSDAEFYSITATINGFQNRKYTHTSELIDFPGWKIVEKNYTTDNKEYQYLQLIKQNEIIPYKKISSKVFLKGLKQHYTEARLVQLLEEKGIGRPSTFSSLVDKIQERGYVKKENIEGKEIACMDYEVEYGKVHEIVCKREFGNEKNKLVLKPLGKIVMEFLEKHFSEIFNYDYTSLMEEELDKIAKGEKIWHELCKECNDLVDKRIHYLKDDTKIEYKIDENNTYIVGKYGPVIKYSSFQDGKEEIGFKPINPHIDIQAIEENELTIEQIVDTTKTHAIPSTYILGQYEDKDVILKKGKFGLYITCGDTVKKLKELGNRPIENIRFEDVKKYLDEGSNVLREIDSNMSIRKSSKGEYLFYKTKKMKKPQFHSIANFYKDTKEDYKVCKLTTLKSWIKDTYGLV